MASDAVGGSVPRNGGTWVIDLDGVVWLAQEPIAGGAEAVDALRRSGIRALFATNNSSPTVGELVERLARAGIEAPADDVVTSAQAAASVLAPGDRVLLCADDGVREAVEARRAVVVEEPPVDAVVVGWTRRFDFDLLARTADAVRRGGRFIGTNEDATHPTPTGLWPGSGALLAAVAAASERVPEVAGKPHPPMVEQIRQRAADIVFVVGDRPSTDGLLAAQLGVPYGQIASAVAVPASAPADGRPHWLAPDLRSLVADVLAG